jgi:putative transposase
MPRGPRVDVPDALYHVIARGVERRTICRSDTDREDFVRRLIRLGEEENVTLFAYVLMTSHSQCLALSSPMFSRKSSL